MADLDFIVIRSPVEMLETDETETDDWGCVGDLPPLDPIL